MEDEKYKLPAYLNTVSETQRWIVNDIRPQIVRMRELLVNTNQTNSSIMKNKEIFKVGDVVYHLIYGVGKVIEIVSSRKYPVVVRFNRTEDLFTEDGRHFSDRPKMLSFTPYDLVNGGFSQERPLPDIEVDTLVYVKDGNECVMRYFAHFGSRGEVYCFRHQKKSNETTLKDFYFEWSLTNPLEEK